MRSTGSATWRRRPASPCSITSTTLACWTWAAEKGTASAVPQGICAGAATPPRRLVLTAQGDTHADKIAGLDAGADDHLTKTFDSGANCGVRLRALDPARLGRRQSGAQNTARSGSEPAAKIA